LAFLLAKLLLQQAAKQIGKEVMIPVPSACIVQRHNKQVGSLKLLQYLLAVRECRLSAFTGGLVLRAEKEVAQWTGQSFQDRGFEQELLQVGALLV
jgi:hypothetical protein